MTNALRSELRKLRHTRSLLAVLLVGLTVAVVGTCLFLAGGKPNEIAARLSDHGPLRFGPTNFGLLFVVFGVRLFTDETQHHTITSTYTRTPDRRKVLAAKAVIATAAAVVFTLVVNVLIIPITAAGLRIRDLEMTYDLGPTAALAGRATAAMVLFTTLGLFIGAALRNRTVALVAVLVWFALAESVLAALVDIERFLPGPVFQDLVTADARHSSAPVAALILAAVVTATAAVAVLATRRDVP